MVRIGIKPVTTRSGSKENRLAGIVYNIWLIYVALTKASSTELAETVNSRFRQYRDAATCYVLSLRCSRIYLQNDDNSYQLPRNRLFGPVDSSPGGGPSPYP